MSSTRAYETESAPRSVSTNEAGAPTMPVRLPDALRPWFAEVEVGAAPGAGDPRRPYAHLPDTAAKLVVRTGEDGDRTTMVVGPRTRASYHESEQSASCVQLHLEPGTVRPLLGVPAGDLVGRVIRLDDFLSPSARRLADQLRSVEGMLIVHRLAEVLPAAHPALAADPRTALVRAAARAVSAGGGRLPEGVPGLARRLAVSERQLRHLFAEQIGVSPKHFARIARVRHVLTHRSPAVPWAQFAAATGYYDQSHLTADFRALMGVPPTSFFTGRLPASQPCQAFARP
ncbi:helix-turn-helix domain-containing protein [Streptomyces sp. NPDC057474]|uniref:AraC family transcriptional regulator n=1 Tax=Streptomyces sp. NPDC057474 TaxID=3346144 RepID=UPI0036845711